ncbi:hypothetical protein CK203_073479 [Vitis vinifera]|uniref:Retrovirus-related Pol polyprotein from transposon TNT 1-94 n=1 Tax=Vitis vinifera TaxID=29760 RepID=A0A438EK07_VITVI|nr:hypothetical protein CK203_073479 [Vitis vinifera]
MHLVSTDTYVFLSPELNNFQFAGVAVECCCCHSKIVLSWETDALRFSKHLWRRRICFKEIVFSTRLAGPFVTPPISWELNILSKEASPGLGHYTPLGFPGNTLPSGNPTVAQVPAMPTAVPISVSPGEKEKFSGLNFKRWQQKMLFYLTTLNLARFLTEDAPKLKEDEHDIQVISAIDAWKHSDFLCRNYVMNGLADSLYNVYSDKKTAKELWESLDRKYKTEGCRG